MNPMSGAIVGGGYLSGDTVQVDLEGDQSRDGYVLDDVDYQTTDAACGPDVRFNNRRPVRGYLATGFLADKDEIDIYDIPISKILDQYMAHLEVLRLMELDEVGDFLVMAANLCPLV